MTRVTLVEVVPVTHQNTVQPSWKRPGLRLSIKGIGLCEAILMERNNPQRKEAKKAGLKTQQT